MSDDIKAELGMVGEEGSRPRRGRPPQNRYEAGRIDGSKERSSERPEERSSERIPMHVQRMGSNAAEVPPGYHGHWVLDSVAGRIDKMLLAGYMFARKDGQHHANPSEGNGIDSRISRPGGGGATLYLMIIPKDIYEQDQEAKNAIAEDQLAGLLLNQDPSMYSRDASGQMVKASEFVRREEVRR